MKHIFISQSGDIVSDDIHYVNMFNTLLKNDKASVENYTIFYDNKFCIKCKVAYVDDQIKANIAFKYFKGPILIQSTEDLTDIIYKKVDIGKGKQNII